MLVDSAGLLNLIDVALTLKMKTPIANVASRNVYSPPKLMLDSGIVLPSRRPKQREEALRLIHPFEEKYPNPGVSMQWFARVYALLGDEPNTVKWLERSADMHEWSALNLAVHPVYAPMRNSPRFRALEKRMGLDQ